MTITSFVNRLVSLLPRVWFSDEALTAGSGVLYAILYMIATELYTLWQAITYVATQTRISTATDTNLDAIATDLFGTPDMQRYVGETDSVYSARIKERLIAPQPTIAEIQKELNAYFAYNPIGLSSVYVFDRQSDPTTYDSYGLVPDQGIFVITLTFAAVNISDSWFLGQAFLGQDTFLYESESQTLFYGSSNYTGLNQLVDQLRAVGTKPVYAVRV